MQRGGYFMIGEESIKTHKPSVKVETARERPEDLKKEVIEALDSHRPRVDVPADAKPVAVIAVVLSSTQEDASLPLLERRLAERARQRKKDWEERYAEGQTDTPTVPAKIDFVNTESAKETYGIEAAVKPYWAAYWLKADGSRQDKPFAERKVREVSSGAKQGEVEKAADELLAEFDATTRTIHDKWVKDRGVKVERVPVVVRWFVTDKKEGDPVSGAPTDDAAMQVRQVALDVKSTPGYDSSAGYDWDVQSEGRVGAALLLTLVLGSLLLIAGGWLRWGPRGA